MLDGLLASTQRTMEIRNPRRILFLGHPDSGVLPLLKELTGSAPTPRIIPLTTPAAAGPRSKASDDGFKINAEDDDTLATIATTAGLTHTLSLNNTYYSTTVPIWLDEPQSQDEWQADFTSNEAKDVVRAIGAWVVVFRLNNERARGAEWALNMMDAVRAVLETAHGSAEAWDGVLLCVGVSGYVSGTSSSAGPTEVGGEGGELRDLCLERGFEFVDASNNNNCTMDSRGETCGVARLIEALEANDWNADDDAEEALGLLDNEEDEAFGSWESGGGGVDLEEDSGLALERAEAEREIMELKLALSEQHMENKIEDDGVDLGPQQVEELERMMGKMLAVKDMTAHMPPSERKKFAARAVHDVMKSG